VLATRTRARRGYLLGAGTPYHLVRQPNGTFLGVIKVSAADRAAATDASTRLAELLERPLPEGWEEEFEAKTARWKQTLHRHGAAGIGGGGASEEMPEDVLEEDADEVEEPAAIADVELGPEDAAELRLRVAAAEQDVTALLLFGLVRSAVRVSTSHLRRLFWARPLSPPDVARAATRIGDHDEERALLDSAVKANDGFFTTHFVSPYSKYIARWAARRGLTPNQVSAFSMLVGLLAAAGFATGERAGLVAGAILLQAAFTLDCVDGQLARYTRTFTAFGSWLDSTLDRAKEYAVFAGLAIGAAAAGDDVWVLAAAALTLQTARHTMDLAFNLAQDQAMLPAVARPLDGPPAPGELRPVSIRAARAARLARIDRSPNWIWARKIVAFPIGERFAAISITAALFDARATFIVLLVLGGIAAAYTGGGRVLRSFGRRGPRSITIDVDSDARDYRRMRDDGPLARALGRTLGPRVPVPAFALAGTAALLLIAAVVAGDDSWELAWIVIGAGVIAGGISAGRPLSGRLRWTVPPLLRLLEYAGLIWVGTLAAGASEPAAFAFLCAITFRHYDSYYRARQRGDEPPAWLGVAAGGWDGRLLAGLAVAALGAVPAGLYVLATLLATLLLVENAASWIGYRRHVAPAALGDEGEGAE
jgi:phosphatidylglycerophosphate synthase